MSTSPSIPSRSVSADGSQTETEVAAALQEYLAALEDGAPLSRSEFLARHPAIAPQLLECLKSLDLVHEAAREMGGSAAHAHAHQHFDIQQVPLGDFKIIREVGRGGMGIVYEGLQLSLGRRVAVKVLPFVASLDAKYLQRFKNEARSAAQLHHANIVPVYAVGNERGVHYYAMQFIDGFSLADLVTRRRQQNGSAAGQATIEASYPERVPSSMSGEVEQLRVHDFHNALTQPSVAAPAKPLAVSTAANRAASTAHSHSNRADSPTTYFRTVVGWIRQAAQALDHAHQLGIIHRDIKPANLLIDERNNLWITDFGLALFLNDLQLTRTGDMVGTLRYMSPEQAAGDRVVLDHRADLYSLGATLYELLTLENVVNGKDVKTLLRQIIQDEPRPLRAIDKRIPVELETIVLKALAKSPKDRYATAAEMGDDLQRWLDDKPIQARRPSLAERVARWGRRNPGLVGATTIFLLIACAILSLSMLFISRETARTRNAYIAEKKARVAADESFRQAWQAVDTFRELTEAELTSNPTHLQTRRRFLAATLDFYNQFLQQRKDDPEVQKELQATATQVERIMSQLTMLEQVGPMLLLEYSSVQDDLQLSPEQQAGIELVMEEGLGNLQQQNDGEFSNVLRSFYRRMTSILTDAQLQRLQQIALQQRGPFVFKTPEVIAALDLTSEQLTAVNRIIQENRPDKRGPGGPREGSPDDHGGPPREFDDGFGPMFGDGPGGRKGPPPRPREFDEFSEFAPFADDHRPPPRPHRGPRGELFSTMKTTTEQICAELSPAQLAKWQAMVGKPFLHDLHWHPNDVLP